jgi:uncharacterized protein YbjT (DUF2867 family)
VIVITTPTGQIGRQVLAQALESEAAIRVVVRDSSRLSSQARERVEIIQGSIADPRVVNDAFAGADAVFWLVPPDPRAESVQEHILKFVRPLCMALNTQNVGRVVAVSSLGRGVAKNAGQISAIFAMDDLIESTGVAYRSLQPPGFMENVLWQMETIARHGSFFGPQSPERKNPTCTTRDIASTAAKLLLDNSWSGQDNVPLLGAEDLSPDDMAQIMSQTLHRPVRYQQIPSETYKATLTQHGMTAAWAQGLVNMAAAADRGIYQATPRTPESSTTTPFRQWCEEVLQPAIQALN